MRRLSEGVASPRRRRPAPGPRGARAKRRVAAGMLLLLAACGRADGPEAVAGRFMDDYYVRADLAAARRLVDGLASKKIEAQEALTRGQAVGMATEGRSVAYSLVGRGQDGDRHLFRYEVKVTVRGGGSFTRRSILVVAPAGGGWRVTNFEEGTS